MLRRVVVALAVALPLLMMGEELPNAPTVLLHRFVSDSCELVEPATLNALKEYTWLHTKQGEMFSPELGKRSYVSYEQNVPKQTVELGRMSGFELRPVAAQAYEATIVDRVGKGLCPSYEEGLKLAESDRLSTRRRLQHKVYRAGKHVTPPDTTTMRYDGPVEQQVAREKAMYSGVGKFEGQVVIEAVVGVDGSVIGTKVVRRSIREVTEKASSIVKTQLFYPARLKGLPVPYRMNIEMNFRMYH